jgi:hypothetical protein
LTAELRFVPLWFFENRSGRLQFLKLPLGGANGIPLDPGAWMITKGDGIMEACSIAYMFKNMALKDWVSYSDKFGTPGVLGRTNAAKDSQAGASLFAAVQQFGQNWTGVVYGDDGTVKDPISLIQAKGEGVLPFPILVERMDRAMASLWRGGDLGTMSADRKGVPLQDAEGDILLDDDAATITETLNMFLDRWIIWQRFGAKPKALSRLVVPKTVNIEKEAMIFKLLLEAGAQIGMKATMDRFGIPMLRKDDTPLSNPATLMERVTDAETGDEVPVEPKGVTVKQQKIQQQANAKRLGAIRGLMPDRSGAGLAHYEWLESHLKSISEAKTSTDIANEISLSIKGLQQWADSAYPSDSAKARTLENAVITFLIHE